jgi:F-type H+-transporting ATPase subunit epsilon
MPEMLELQIVTPAQRVLAESVDEIVLPGDNGYLGVRPGHAPLLVRLQVGELTYNLNGKPHSMAISGGYAEILRTGVSVLAETAETAADIDLARAEKARDRAQARLQGNQADIDFARAEIALNKALNRISTKGRGRV